jgi:predicted RNA-binding protein associated with RNAse of E/G family
MMFAFPGASYSIYAMWEGGHSKFAWWYINLQEPLRRTPLGFDTRDYFLDIVLKPDLTDWVWKDEDEFDEAIKLGIFSLEKAEEIRDEGKRVLNLVETKKAPFCDGWEDWSPPEKWVIPKFPEVWENIYT